jgi:hypothetical protein
MFWRTATGLVVTCMQNDLRLASTIKLYNPPPVEKRRCNPRLKSNEQSLDDAIKSVKSGYQTNK